MANIIIQPSSGILDFSTGVAGPNLALTSNLSGTLRFQYDNQGGINLSSHATGKNRFSIEGSGGQIFSVTDELDSSLFRVNDINGLPFVEIFNDDTAIIGSYGQNTIVISGDSVGIGRAPSTGIFKLHVSGNANVEGELKTSGLLIATNNDLLSTGNLLATNIHTTGTNLKTELQNTGNTLKTDLDILRNSSDTFLRIDSTSQSILGNKTFIGNVIIENLTVTGSQSIASSNDLTIASNFIVINSGEQGPGIFNISGGLIIDRGTGAPDFILYYNELTNRLEYGLEGSVSGVASAERLDATTNNLESTGNNLFSTISSLSGTLNQSGVDLFNRDASLSGSLDSYYNSLFARDSSLSGSLNQTGQNLFIFTSNVQTSLRNSGNFLETIIKTGYVHNVGDQDISGLKNFAITPTVNNVPVVTANNIADQVNIVFQTGNQIVSGEKTFINNISSPNIVYLTGNQNISGTKNFLNIPTVSGNPVLVSGTFGTVDIETARVTLNDGVIEQNINFIKSYTPGTKPIVTSNLYFSGENDDIISHQIQNVTHTGFKICLSRPATGYAVNYLTVANTGASFLALGATTSVFSQRVNLQTGTSSQYIPFSYILETTEPKLSIILEDKNEPPTEDFFLFKATGINPTGFYLYFSQPINHPNSGYYAHIHINP